MARKRFTGYTEEELESMRALARAGFTIQKIAHLFGFRSEASLYDHNKKDPRIMQAIKEGSELSVAKVANQLYKRAIGYEYDELTYSGKGEDDEGNPILTLTKKVTKHVPPDVFAANAFLNNRSPENWKSKREGETNPKYIFNVTIGDKQVKKLQEVKKQLKEAEFIELNGESTD